MHTQQPAAQAESEARSSASEPSTATSRRARVARFASSYRRHLALGLLSGLVAGCAMTVVMLLLRLVVGVPLTFELGGDRVLPQFSVTGFLNLLDSLGGPISAKTIALYATLGGQVALAGLIGFVYAILKASDTPSSGSRGAPFQLLVAVVGVSSIFTIAFFWPVLGANFVGIGRPLAGFVTAAGLIVSFASFALALAFFFGTLTRTRLEAGAPAGAVPRHGAGRSRREVVVGAIGGAAVLSAGGLTKVLDSSSALGYDGFTPPVDHFQPVTSNRDFYVVTKNIVDPRVSKSAWELDISGDVRSPHKFAFDELARQTAVEREITLECISNDVGGGLISNAIWTGVPLRELIAATHPSPDVRNVFIYGADGYTHSMPIGRAMADTTIVAYRMNGAPLPDRHGYPARILAPGTYGEVNVKWVTKIELIDGRRDGYFEQQGWKALFVGTTSRFNQPQDQQTFRFPAPIQLSGIAFAGDRGISKVEVSSDGGDSWSAAKIEYDRAKTAWAVWSYVFKPDQPDDITLAVRATDGSGALQGKRDAGIESGSGASGYHSIDIHVSKRA